MASCSTEQRFVKQLKNNAYNSGIKFLNQKSYNKAKRLFFNNLDNSYLKGDTTIFIEDIEDVHGRYSCCIYTSNTNNSACYDVKEIFLGKHRVKRELVKIVMTENKKYIIQSIKDNQLDEKIVKLGAKVNFSPQPFYIITIATKSKNATYVINSYRVKWFGKYRI